MSKNFANIVRSKKSSLDEFEKEILSEALEGTIFLDAPIKNVGQIGNQYIYDVSIKNRRYFIKILLDLDSSHEKEIDILTRLSDSDCAPNVFLHKTQPYQTLILECPKAKFYTEYEGTKNQDWLPFVLQNIHGALGVENSDPSYETSFDFFEAFEPLEGFAQKLTEFVSELRQKFYKAIKEIPQEYVLSSLNFMPLATLYDGRMFMPIDWSGVKKMNRWLEAGSVFLAFGCKDWKAFSAAYDKEVDSKNILCAAAIHNLIYYLLVYSLVSSGANVAISNEETRKLLKKSLEDVFKYCDVKKEIVSKVKLLLKF